MPRGAWRFFAGDAPEMVPVVMLVVGLAFVVRHEPYAVAVLPVVAALGLSTSVVMRARARRSRPRLPAEPGSVERQLPVGAAQSESLDQ
jgi:hypothetical protein